jgi:hypothetical protein
MLMAAVLAEQSQPLEDFLPEAHQRVDIQEPLPRQVDTVALRVLVALEVPALAFSAITLRAVAVVVA